jgi:aryl-alcohol dehydrogenase-like predicted oxidoreductase
MEKLLDLNILPDLVQLPYSVLDRKFETKMEVLKQLGAEIHVRSVFLQGLYFMNPKQLPQKLQPLEAPLTELHAICLENNVTVGDVALNCVIENPKIDKVVIGVETVVQLKQNLQTVANWKPKPKIVDKIQAIRVENIKLLNPVNW